MRTELVEPESLFSSERSVLAFINSVYYSCQSSTPFSGLSPKGGKSPGNDVGQSLELSETMHTPFIDCLTAHAITGNESHYVISIQ